MAELETIDYEATFKKLLLSQYKKPNFTSLFKILSQIFSDIQDSNFELRDKFWLCDATGQQLDFIGGLWDVSRSGDEDEAYRARIRTQIARSSSGTIQEIKNVLQTAYGATYVEYFPEYPGKYRIRTDADIPQSDLDELSAAGVTGFLSDYIIDEQGNNLITFSGFETSVILDEAGANIIDALGNTLEYPINNLPSDFIMHVAG